MNTTTRARAGGRRLFAGLTVSATLLTTAACAGGGAAAGSASVPGVTDTEITLGTTQPLTGPAAPGYSKIHGAMEAYFNYVNANGGINGRKIKLLVEDDGYNPTNTVTKTRKLVQQDKVFALVGALGTPTHTAVLDFIRQNNVPDLMVASGSVSWNQPKKYPTTFGFQTDYRREGKILATYVKQQFPGKRYCSFGQSDDFGASGLEGLQAVLGADGLKDSETYSVANTNVAPQLGKLQAAKCDVVFAFTVPGFTALAMGTAAQLGYKTQWVVSSSGADPSALTAYLKGAAPALLEGMLGGNYMPPIDETENSWVKLFTSINQKYNPGTAMDSTVQYGYTLAYTAAQALKAAGKDLTRESLVKAMEAGGFAGPGLAPLAYSSGDHSGFTGLQVAEYKGGTLKGVSPVYTTDTGAGPIQEYTQKQPDAPANGLPQ